MVGRLLHRVGIVTGAVARRGIGRTIAAGMAREGAPIAAGDVDLTLAEEAAETIRAVGRQAIAVRADVLVAADVQSMVEEIVRVFRRVDLLVNNAGIGLFKGSPYDIYGGETVASNGKIHDAMLAILAMPGGVPRRYRPPIRRR